MMEQDGKPFRIGKNIIVKLPDASYEPENNDIIVSMDPGGVFGSGRHGATRMCIESLENIITEPKWPMHGAPLM